MAQIFEVVLDASGCSGRKVRFKVLTSAEVDKLSLDAAALQTDNASSLEYSAERIRLGIQRMLVSVESEAGSGQLVKTSAAALSGDGDDSYNALFSNSKDNAVLGMLFSRYHDISRKDVEDIMGKAQAVSSD